MNAIIHCLLASVLAIWGGYTLGKRSLDTLIDSDPKGALGFLKASAAVEVVIVLLTIVMKGERVPYIMAALLFCLGVAGGIFLPLLWMKSCGLKTNYHGEVLRDLTYDEGRDETGYDLYLPETKSQTGYSLILAVHGGGFSGGSKEDEEAWCKYMSGKGYVSASLNYTLADGKHETSLTLMVKEIRDCVAAIKEKCTSLGYPVDEMALTGSSAGGCLAMLYAYKYADETPIPIKFVFQQTGPAYFDPLVWGTTNYNTAHQAAFTSMMTGVQVTEEMVKRGEHYPLIEAISPSCYVSEKTVPTLCAYGPRDKMVPAQVKYYLFDAFERSHVTYDYIEYPHSNHGMYDDPKAHRAYLSKLDEYLKKYFSR